jgi:Family of unknown function (DUF5681)
VPRKRTATSFRAGTSGNPGGRPKAEICLTALLRAALAERDVEGKRTKARAVIDALVSEACQGKTAAIQQIFDRIDGLLQPILEGPALDLEAVARAMAAKYETIRPGGPPARDEG